MAKITEQNVPPELQSLYEGMVSPQDAAAPDQAAVRTRRRVRRGNGPRESVVEMRAMRAAASFVLDRAKKRHALIEDLPSVTAATSELVRGIFNDRFWMLAEQIGEQVLESVPTFTETETRPTYLYPDPHNRPSIVNYPSGSLSAGFPRYEGMTSGEVFRDTLLRWRMIRHDPFQELGIQKRVPALLHVSGLLQADASDREARALRTVTYQAKLTAEGSAIWNEYAYPFAGAPNTWPTKRTPPSAPPYYDYMQQIGKVRNINYSAKYVADGTREIITYAAPLPMAGYRFNNNTTISTEWTGNEEIYVPLYADGIRLAQIVTYGNTGEVEDTRRGISLVSEWSSESTSDHPGHLFFESSSKCLLAGFEITTYQCQGERDSVPNTSSLTFYSEEIHPDSVPTGPSIQYFLMRRREGSAFWPDTWEGGNITLKVSVVRYWIGGGIEVVESHDEVFLMGAQTAYYVHYLEFAAE
jgi:hypothetical protein